MLLSNITVIDDSKKPDMDKKKALEKIPLNISDMSKTLKNPILKYSFFP